MLTIDINGTYFALDPDFSVMVVTRNPACFTDTIPGDSGLNITLPVNDINRGILGSPERFDKYLSSGGSSIRFVGCTIRFGGVQLMQGTLRVSSATGESYDCWLQSDLGAMAEKLEEKKITDFAWPTGQVFDVDEDIFDPDEFDYGVTRIHNPGFWEGKGKEVDVDVNYMDANGYPQVKVETRSVLMHKHFKNYGWWVNVYNAPATIYFEPEGCVISPYLYLGYVLREALRFNQWHIGRNDFGNSTFGEGQLSQPLMKHLQVYNNFNILEPETVEEEIIIRSWHIQEQEYAESEVLTIVNILWKLGTFDYVSLLPKISMKEFIMGLQNTLNYVFRFRNDGKVDIIDRNAILATTPIDLNKYHLGQFEMGEKKELALKFMPEYDKDDAKFENFEDLTGRAADFGVPVADYNALTALANPTFGELRLVIKENKIYEYKWLVIAETDALQTEVQYDVLGWEMVSVGPQPYLYGQGAGQEEIKSPVGPVHIRPSENFSVWQKGNLSAMRSAWKDFAFRLIDGRTQGCKPQNLFWEGPDGVFKNRWENWARFWTTRHEFYTVFDLPVNATVMVAENITNTFKTEQGEFIIEEMKTEFSLDTVGATRIIGYKI